ncbi:hypothetical protein ACTQ6A_00690 [Lachnospiraceae bacterium LCP25S3_G4]
MLQFCLTISDYLEQTEKAEPIDEIDTNLMLRVLAHIKVCEEGMLVVVFLDGTEIEYRAGRESQSK